MFALQEAMAILAEQPQSYDEAATIALSALSALPELAGPLAELTKLVGWRMTDSHTGMATAPFLIETPVTPPSFLRLPWRLPVMGPCDSWWAFRSALYDWPAKIEHWPTDSNGFFYW